MTWLPHVAVLLPTKVHDLETNNANAKFVPSGHKLSIAEDMEIPDIC